jgi:hypothetical protein
VNQREIVKYRIFNQQLAGTHLSSADEMVARFGAMQAEEYAQTKWAWPFAYLIQRIAILKKQ